MSNELPFKPTNLATCYDNERTYYKDMPTGRMFTNKDCLVEINNKGEVITRTQVK